ncbi:MAG: GNAT family N-acetyltransferase [Candidatus Nealsonbacteria bacterium]
MENKFLKINNERQWQNLLEKALFKTFFHDLKWEKFLEEKFKWLKFEHFIYQNRVLLILARCKVGNKEKLISHPFCEYGGPLPLIKNIDFKSFKEDLFGQFKELLKISFHPEISLGPEGEEKYFFGNAENLQFNRCSYIIEGFQIQRHEELWQNFRKSTRQEINKAQNAGLIIKECKDKKELKDFYSLYLLKAKQHKIPAYPYSFFKYFFESPKGEIILAEFENKIVAGSVFLFYDKYIHYFLNASSSEGAEKRANHLILWEQIKKYCGKGKYFDLGGTRKGSSLEVFKKGFSATHVEIYELKNFTEKKKEKFSFIRKAWGFLPTFLIERLSPKLLKYKL